MLRTQFISALGASVLVIGCSSTKQPPNGTGPGTYISIVSSDLESARDWYAYTFEADIAAERENEAVRILMLRGKSTVIEIIQYKSELPEVQDRHTGLFKVGTAVDSLEREIARLKLGNIISESQPTIVDDDDVGIRSIVIRDTDDNRIQLFEYLSQPN